MRWERRTDGCVAHPLFRSVLPPTVVVFAGSGAGAVDGAASAAFLPFLLPVRLCNAPLMPPTFLVVVVAVDLAVLAAAAGFFMIVVVLVESLSELLRALAFLVGSWWTDVVDEVVTAAGRLICLEGARVGLVAAVGPVNIGFAGLAGRGTNVLVGDAILMGDVGSVRELCDLGDSTCPGTGFRVTALAAFTAAGMLATGAVVFVRFLGFSRVTTSGASFSLSET